MIAPSRLKHWYEQGFVVPLVVKKQFRDDPWQVAKPVLEYEKNAFFFDSANYHDLTARYSFLGWDPFLVFERRNQKSIINKLREVFRRFPGKHWDEIPFFTSGAAGYFSYELGREFEKLPDISRNDLKLPEASLVFPRRVVVFDRKASVCYLVLNLVPEKDGNFEQAFQKAEEKIGASTFLEPNQTTKVAGVRIQNFHPDIAKAKFKQMVVRAKEYIKAGDIYQANLSQRFSFNFKGNPALLYESLRKINPSPFSSFLKLGGLSVLSVSPERLIKKTGNFCQTRPIAGTRPRGRNKAEDKRFLRDLIQSSKERAEHLMLVDLERNDLGRVCMPHSVRVSEFMALEQYSHVNHIVSNVVGTLRKDRDQFDLLRAMFPGGTITGCPKIRSMEIIEELEPFKRNLYTGSIGYIDFAGDMDLNIIIRSLVLYRDKGYLQVGAGVVYDSEPEQEYWETLHKGKALIDALARHI